jgi:hypothetical protein
VVAPVEVEEVLREEVRPVAREVVRRLLVELAREEVERIAASLNGGPSSPRRSTPRSVPDPDLAGEGGQGGDPTGALSAAAWGRSPVWSREVE